MTTNKDAALRAELAELEAANEAAPSWGAAVGARHERIVGIKRQLARDNAQGAQVRRQYYFRVNGCQADHSGEPACTCWHDEGTGPLSNQPSLIQSWRDKPVPPAPASEPVAWREALLAAKFELEMHDAEYHKITEPRVIALIDAALATPPQAHAGVRTYTEVCKNEKCPRGGLPVEIVLPSSDGGVKESPASIPDYNGVKSPALVTAHGLSGKSCPLSQSETGPSEAAQMLLELLEVIEAVKGDRDILRVSGLIGDRQDVGVVGIEQFAQNVRALASKPRHSGQKVADEIIGQIEERFPNWRSYRDLVDCIDCTLHDLRSQPGQNTGWYRALSDREPDHGQYANGGPAERPQSPGGMTTAPPDWKQDQAETSRLPPKKDGAPVMADILEELRGMPSSLNDALRTMATAADEIGLLRRQVERVRQSIEEWTGHQKQHLAASHEDDCEIGGEEWSMHHESARIYAACINRIKAAISSTDGKGV